MGINPIPIEAHSMQANELVDLKPVTKDIDEDQKSTSPSVELPITLSRAYPPSSTSDKLAVPQRGAQMKPRITSIPRSAIVRTLLLHQQHSRTSRLTRSYHHPSPNPPTHPPTNEKMSPYPFTPLPCQLCNTFACATPEEPSHDSPVMIALAHASKVESSTACTIFCGDDSPFNTVCILHDAADKFSRAEAILHTAAMSLKNIAASSPGTRRRVRRAPLLSGASC